MAMLTRFRNRGGFHQLLQLIETCDSSKQSHLLNLVGLEDPGWAYLIKQKSLTAQKILKWDQTVLESIFKELSLPILMGVFQGALMEEREKILLALPYQESKHLLQQLDHKSISHQEISLSQIRFIQWVRGLNQSGKIQISKIDPSLDIDPRIAA